MSAPHENLIVAYHFAQLPKTRGYVKIRAMDNTDFEQARNLAHQLIPQSRYVKPCAGGVQICLDDQFAETDTVFCSDDELDKVHPYFSSTLRMHGAVESSFRSSKTQRILVLWSCDIFVTDSDERLLGLHVVDDLCVDDEYLHLAAGGFQYVHVSELMKKVSLRLPVENITNLFKIHKSWLDEHYPGWKHRLEMAVSLDLDKTECLRSALKKERTYCADLPFGDLVA